MKVDDDLEAILDALAVGRAELVSAAAAALGPSNVLALIVDRLDRRALSDRACPSALPEPEEESSRAPSCRP